MVSMLLLVLRYFICKLSLDPLCPLYLHLVSNLEEELPWDQGSHLAAPHKIPIPVEFPVAAPN